MRKKRCMIRFEVECDIQQVSARLGVDIVLCDVLDLMMKEKILPKLIKGPLYLEEIDQSHPTILKKRVIWLPILLENHLSCTPSQLLCLMKMWKILPRKKKMHIWNS